MEWMNKGDRPAPTTQATAPSSSKRRFKGTGAVGIATAVLIFSATILAVAAIYLFAIRGGNGSENSYVDSKKMQAVFLNGGQVYFGNIKNLNDKYMRVSNIYYLRVNQTVQPDGTAAAGGAQDISLVKLGCELHGPTDEMLINREQVVFWENLKTDGQVAKAVADYVKQNPKGQDCNAAANSNQQQTGTGTGTTTPATGTSTTPATGTGTGTGTGTTNNSTRR
jgi:hypothetical protein